VPSRGEVWLVDLGMIQKVRPALILSRSFKDEDRALISVIPHTTSLRGSDLEIRFTVPFLQPGAFLAQNPITTLRRRTCPPWRPAEEDHPACSRNEGQADLSRRSSNQGGLVPP
jgi:mRNA interferase MazF